MAASHNASSPQGDPTTTHIKSFCKETDYTLLNYLTRYRIHKAMELLRDCRVKVYEVAERVGYRDITYFSATFKKLAGMSPSEYQDRCR